MGRDEQVPDRRTELAEQIARRRARARSAVPSGRTEAPLAEGQLRYWLGWRAMPDSFGRVVRRFEVHGHITQDHLEAAVRAALERADGLRCSYPEVEGVPRQRVHPVDQLPFTWHVPSGVDDLHSTERAVEARAAQPVDLRTGPPTEVHLIAVAPDHHRVVLITHATAIDGWAEHLFVTWLQEACAGGDGPGTGPRFVDLAAWESEQPPSEARDLWRRMFDGVDRLDPWSELPGGTETRVQAHDLSPATVRSLLAIAEERGTTVFGVLLSAVLLVLGDEWDLDRPLVDISTAGRTHPDAEVVVGRFAQLRPIAGDLRDDPTVSELVRRVGADLLDVLDTPRAPLHHMLAELPSRGRVTFRSVHVQYRSFPRPARPRGAPWVAPVDLRPEGHTALEISALPQPDGSLRVITRRTPRPHTDPAVDRSADRVLAMLVLLATRADVLDAPSSKAAALAAQVEHPALPDPDAELSRHWDATVLDRVRSSTAQRPAAIAVEAGDVTLTYAELAERAESLASALRARGVEPGQPVVVTGRRSAGLVVAMLGVLEAGGVIVPLPDDLPDGALAERAEVVGARVGVVVGDRPVPWLAGDVRLGLDGALDPAVAGEVAPSGRVPNVGPDAPAYVFFTSGTTGRARSVVGLHGSLCQFLDWQRSTFRIGPNDRVALATSIGFDVVLRNVFLPLACGGTVVVAPDPLDPEGALGWLAASRVTVLHVTPGLARAWLQLHHGAGLPNDLRWTFFAGEPLTGELVDRWRGMLPAPGHVVNFYGPTETCMTRAAYCVPDVVDPGPVPVGWPVDGSQLLVVDSEGRRVAPGERGEVVVRTEHGTAGYGNAPELWAERAVQGERPGQVTYRTGDVGWYRNDGALVVQGRLDDEVKVGGVRVHPQDVAQRLRRLPGVAAAEVIADTTGPEVRLVAAVVPVPAAGSTLDATAVRVALGAQVPAASVPSSVLVLERLPLTANGKVDREALRALAAPPAAEGEDEGELGAADDVGSVMVELWREVFPGREVELDSDFFELGGHSLVTLRLIHRIRARFGVELGLQDVFAADTPRAMAELVRSSTGTPAETPVGAPGVPRRVPITWQQQHYCELHELDPEFARAPLVLGRLASPALDVGALRGALGLVAQRHDALRTTFDVVARELVIAPDGEVPLEVIELAGPVPASDELRERCVALVGPGVDLDAPHLVHAKLVRFHGSCDVLLLVAHHAVVDGVSIEVLADEIELAHRALVAGLTPELPPVTCTTVDVVEHQRESEAGGRLDADLDYWRSVLPSELPRLELPTDHPRGATRSATPGQCAMSLRPSDRRRLEELATAQGSTAYRVLAALWAAHVTALAAVDEVVVGMPAMTRELPGSERMAGMFVTTLPLYLQVSDDDTVESLIARATQVVRGAGRHRHPPLHRIRSLVRERWDPHHRPLFATSVNLIPNGAELPPPAGGRSWERLNMQADLLRVDLGLRCYTKGERLTRMVLRYDTDLFERSSAERVLGTFVQLLREVLGGPASANVRELQARLQRDEGHVPVHRLVAEHARQQPSRVAVEGGDGPVTFGELDRRVNGLADELHAADVGPGALVGVHLDRGVDLVIAVLAVHRVGAGYVPLPVDLPSARLALVVDDTAPAAVIADRELPADVGEVPVVRIDRPGVITSAPDPLVLADPDAVAYVIHTSGSTGRPKGSVITQRSLSAFSDVCRPLFGFCDTDRVLLFHSPAFDSSVEEIFSTLAVGGAIVVPPTDLLGSVPHFLRFVAERRLTLLVLPTSFWHVVVRELEETSAAFPASVRLVIVGGQAAEPGAVRRWLERVPADQVRLMNCYGPTEATVSVTSVQLTPGVMVPGEPTPIGRPHPGIEVRIVDTDDREVAEGDLGELLVAGEQVGEGYLGRADLTAERFVQLDGRRWYRTGDLVRRRPDGLIVYHGRNDDQVKVRGFRIEPAEIEAALIDLPDVRDAFVLAETLVEGQEPVLVAHVEPVPGRHLDAPGVRSALGEVLPAHMVPGRVVLHERLPRTAGGKPDRLALREEAPRQAAPGGAPERFELTPAQSGLFFLEMLRGERAFQVIRVVHRVSGPLDVEALRAAVRSVVERHDALRVRFGVDDGAPVQWVEPAAPALDELVPFVDLSGAADPEGERHTLLDELLTRPLAVRDNALVRGVVVRTGNDDHTLALAIHHLVFDAGSRSTLWNDLGDAYVAQVEGRPWTPPPSPLSYRDAVEARARAARDGRDGDLAYWREALAGARPAVALPPSPEPTAGAGVARVSLGAPRREHLHRQAGVARTTPFVLVLTASAAALRDLTGHDDLVLGVPLNDRHLAGPAAADTTGLMGLFVNTLPVRVQVPTSAPLAELVASTRARVVGAMEHGAVSVAELVREVGRDRERAGQAPFNVVVQLVHDATEGSVDLAGLPAERELWPAKGTKFDLSLTFAMRGDDLRLQVDRSGAVLGDERTAELVELVTRHLDALCDAPGLGAVDAEPEVVPEVVPEPAAPPILDGLLDAWCTAFDNPAYGPDDDFFAEGGHSLLAVRLLSLIERATGHDVPVLTLFDHPTPRRLAALLAPGAAFPEAPAPRVVPVPAAPAPDIPEAPAPRGRAGAPPRLHLDRAPLSFAQERFWLLRQLGEDDLYQMPRVWRLVGRLDRSALDAALAAVVARQEILRTRYLTYDDGTPYQHIDPPGPVPVETFDVRDGSPEGLDRAWEQLRRPFDLSAEWSVRVGLLQVSDQEHHLVLSVHHIAGDATTHQQLWAEVREAYVGDGDPRCDLPFQYADLAVWERAQLAAATGAEADPSSPLAAALRYWSEQLAEVPEPLVLPRIDGVEDPERAVVERSSAGADVARGVREVATRLSVTPAAVVLAAAGLSLCRTTGRDEVVIGVPVSTRSLHDEPLIGPFLNTLPVLVRQVDGEAAGDLIRRVAAELAAALEHRAAPFEVLARSSGRRHERWDTALTPVVVNLFDGERPPGSVDMGALRAELITAPPRLAHHARFAITLTARLGVELDLGVERRAEVPPEVSSAWSAGVVSALRSFAEDVEVPVGSVSALDPDTERWLREGLNHTARPFPADRTVDQLVAEQVAARPRHTAVVDGAGRLTYEALAERATGRESALRGCGVRQGDRVGVALERSTELVVTLLACARLGAVYVPVEASQPAARSERILDDAGAVAVVRDDPGRGVVVEERARVEVAAPVDVEGRSALDPAYVMYTSGSTGAPKGVVVPHRAIARLVCNTDYLQLGADDVVALASNPAFDAVTWEVWGALANGATLVVLDRDTVLSPERLHAALERHGVTAMFMTTALFHVMAAERPDMFAGLRALLFGGEVCDAGAVRRVLAAGGPGRLLHVYGPTETTTFACWYPVEGVAPGAATLPIGLPIANTTAHVLDTQGRLVPPGVAGELYLGGAGLALGYLGDGELTAQRFVPDPWSAEPGARLYRTGDLVRRRADGELEFVGRVDRQVKVRGYRVQPEEVELALAAHPLVRAAVVEVVTGEDGTELVAVAEADAAAVEAATLQAHLAGVLPSNMVPSSVAIVETLPVTANGKVDRERVRELTVGGRTAAPEGAEQVAVDGPVAKIWAEVLGVDRPDPDATFFELGGHSLRAVQLFTRLRRELGVDLPLSTLFAHPTLRSLAERLDRASPVASTSPSEVPLASGPGTPEVVVLREGSGPPVVLVHPAGGQLFQYAHLAAALPPGREVVGLAADMESGGGWSSRVEEAAARYLTVLRRQRPDGPYVLGGLSSGGLIAFEMARQLRESGEEVGGLLLLDPTRLQQRWWRGGWAAARRHWRPRAVKKRTFKWARQRLALVQVKVGRLVRRPASTTVVATALLGHHRRMVRRYRPAPTAAPVTTVVALAEGWRRPVEPSDDRARWQRLTGVAPEVVVVQARHAGPRSFLHPPHVEQVAAVASHLLSGSERPPSVNA